MKKNAVLLLLCLCLLGINCYAGSPAHEKNLSKASNSTIDEALGRLQEKMSGMKTLQTDFIQEKNLAVFDQTLLLKGRLFMQKPGFFAWHVMEPMRYSLVIKDNVVWQWDEDSKAVQRVVVSKNPVFKTVIEHMSKWFSGAYTSLRAEYEINLIEENPVSLQFIPHKTAIDYDVIKRVKVIFREDERYIHRIFIEEKSGDSTLLTFVDTMLNIPINEAAWEVRPRAQ